MTPWWDAKYKFRKKITVTAGSAVVPAGYPVKLTENTQNLYTAGKCRSDYNDIRIVYWNGSTWTDLNRDRIDAAILFFSIQAQIAGSGNNSNYYIYYGNSNESTTKQPTTESGRNGAYALYGSSPSAGILLIHHFMEGSGSSMTDDSQFTNNSSTVNSPTWGTTSPVGRYMSFNGSNQYGIGSNLQPSSYAGFTIQCWAYTSSTGGTIYYASNNDKGSMLSLYIFDGKFAAMCNNANIAESSVISLNTWYHVAMTTNYSTITLWINGVQVDSSAASTPPATTRTPRFGVNNESDNLYNYFTGNISQFYVNSSVESSFPMGLCYANPPTITSGNEERYGNLSGGII